MTDTICPSCGLGQHEPGLCLECLGCTECVIDVDTSRCLVCGEMCSSAEYERVCGLLTRALGEPRKTIFGNPLWSQARFALRIHEEDSELHVCSELSAAIGIGKEGRSSYLPLDGSTETDAAIQQVIMCFKRREK